jgi:hypothetical protein
MMPVLSIIWETLYLIKKGTILYKIILHFIKFYKFQISIHLKFKINLKSNKDFKNFLELVNKLN